MSMKDDHQMKAQQLVQFMQTPEYQELKAGGHFTETVDDWVMKAAKKHEVLFQMLQPKGLPNPTGQGPPEQNALQSGTAPQQGGPDPRNTTSRELAPPKEKGNAEANN